MQNCSIHTHTSGFDGRNSVEEMVLCAKKIGWDKIGISNHFIVYPSIEETNMYKAARKIGYSSIYSVSFESALQKFKSNFEEIERVRDKTGFPVYKGMEVDFFNSSEWKKGFERVCAVLKPDYIIGSAHFAELDGTLMNMHDILKLPEQQKDIVISKYWQNIRQAVSYGAFDFMAHLDVWKRRKIGIEEKWQEEEDKTIDVIVQNKMTVEINTAQLKYCAEPNPSLRMICTLKNANVQMFLSDDAHDVEHLSQYYEDVENLLTQNNLSCPQKPIIIAKHILLNNVVNQAKER